MCVYICLGSGKLLPSPFLLRSSIIIIIVNVISPVDSSISRWFIIYYNRRPYSVLCTILLLLLHFFSTIFLSQLLYCTCYYDHWPSRPWTISRVSLIAGFYVFVTRLFVFRISRSDVVRDSRYL